MGGKARSTHWSGEGIDLLWHRLCCARCAPPCLGWLTIPEQGPAWSQAPKSSSELSKAIILTPWLLESLEAFGLVLLMLKFHSSSLLVGVQVGTVCGMIIWKVRSLKVSPIFTIVIVTQCNAMVILMSLRLTLNVSSFILMFPVCSTLWWETSQSCNVKKY